MKVISAAVLGAVFCSVVSGSMTVKEEHRTAFFGEDIHLDLPPGDGAEVAFRPRTNQTAEVVLMRAGQLVGPRGHINSRGHLVLEDVQEEDEGAYTVTGSRNPHLVKKLILIVRDCALEQVVKYGEAYHIHLNQVQGPITLEFRPSVTHPNQSDMHQATEAPPLILFNQSALTAEEYAGRLRVSDKQVTLHSVRITDEGSFTVLDRDGKIRRRNCLNVREHQIFMHVPYGGNLKVKLYLHHSLLNIVFRSKSDNQDRLLVDQGALVAPPDPLLEGRLTVEGSELTVKKVRPADGGVFKVTDLAGFTVAHVYIEVEAYRAPPLTVAILSLIGLIAFMLLICLLSCICKVHQRKEKSKKLTLLAQQAGKSEEGEAFRQVVHDAYTRFTEESLTQSVCDKPSEATEVTIKGLEVSKPGRYHTLSSDNFLEMSDSGVEFTSSALRLDSDTDAAMTFASHKPLLSAVSPTAVTRAARRDSQDATAVPDGELSAFRTSDSALSGSPASNPRSLEAAAPNGSLPEAASPGASPGAASRGAAVESGSGDGAAESGDDGLKEEEAAVAPST